MIQQPYLFDPHEYKQHVLEASTYISSKLPRDFHPKVVITLGSGGLGSIADLIEPVISPIPYDDIPNFPKTTVVGHEGMLYAGYIKDTPIIGLKGRKHFYELGGEPNLVVALKQVVFPVYVMKSLGVSLYVATNAAGGLNTTYNPGDLMVISSHVGLYFPNALLGPQVPLFSSERFQPQHMEYKKELRDTFRLISNKLGYEKHVHEGVYAALTGPTYETSAESQLLRKGGVDAVGMSTVPEIITASNIGMDTFGVSLITNVIASDGTNATSHEEVMNALNDKETKERFTNMFKEFLTQIVIK